MIAAQAWVPLRSTDEAAPNATQSNAAADVEVAVQTNVADVAASDLRAVQRAIASGRWRENSQAKQWAGHAVAAAMKLDVETHKAKIVALLKTWIGNGALVVVEGEDETAQKAQFRRSRVGGQVTFCATCPNTFAGGAQNVTKSHVIRQR